MCLTCLIHEKSRFLSIKRLYKIVEDKYIRNRLREQFTQEWHSLIQNLPKAINYRLFKDNFEFENYFNILEDPDIYTLCKFRFFL
jgi:hypothetical protein